MEHPAEEITLPATGWSRRRFLQASAASAVGAAVIAACSTKDNPPARIGTVPPTTALPTGEVTDVVLVRTATSLEHLLIAAYDTALAQGLLTGVDAEIATKMRAEHEADAATLAGLTTLAGGDPYECPNARMTDLYLNVALQHIMGSAQANEALGIEAPATEIEPSPDQAADTRVLLNALEVITAATHQAYVASLNSIDLRAAGMKIGVGASRRGALWGALVNPDALVDADVVADAPTAVTTTTVEATTTTLSMEAEAAGPPPVVHAVSASFGQLAPVEIEIGAVDANGIRQKLNIETPYLNSMAYEYMTCQA